MVLADMIYAAKVPAGFALIEKPTEKERRFCQSKGIEVVEAGIQDLLTVSDFIGKDELTEVRAVEC